MTKSDHNIKLGDIQKVMSKKGKKNTKKVVRRKKDMNAGAAVLAGDRRPLSGYQRKILRRGSLRDTRSYL